MEGQDGQLQLRDYLEILRRRLWIIVIATIAVAALAFASSASKQKMYGAHAQVLLQSTSADKSTVETEIVVLESEAVRSNARKVVPNLASVTGRTSGNARVIDVSSESPNRNLPAKSVDAVITAYLDYRRAQQVDRLLSNAQQTQTKIDDLKTQIDQATAEIALAGPAGSDVASRRRDALVGQELLLESQLRDAQVASTLTTPVAEVVTPASTPDAPLGASALRDGTIGLGFGALLGVALAFLFELVDDRIKSRSDLERALGSRVPLLGSIPTVSKRNRREGTDVVSLSAPHSTAAEAYRALRTSVQFVVLDKPMASLLVTSASLGEGKSMTVANLAVSMARAGRRVVVVDCDLRRPRAHEYFNLSREVGLTSVMLGDVPLESALQLVEDVPRLAVLPSGPVPPNPSELLSLHRFAEVIASITASGALAIIDSPPVLPVTDAAVVSASVDQVLLVVSAGKSSRRGIRRAVETLRQVDAPLAGVVLNRAPDERDADYAFYYDQTERTSPNRSGARDESSEAITTRPRRTP